MTINSQRRPAARRPSERRAGALRSAINVIARRGVEDTRYRDVAEHSGIPVATLQYMFGSLDNLLLEALEASSEEDLEISRAKVEAVSGPANQLRAFIDHSLGEGPTEWGEWRLWLEFWHLAARDERLREKSYEIQLQWRAVVGEILRRGRSSGVFCAELDIEEAAIQVLAIMDGIALALILQSPVPEYVRARDVANRAIARILRP